MTTGFVRTLKAMSSERRTSGARKASTVRACRPTASLLLAAMSNHPSDEFVGAPGGTLATVSLDCIREAVPAPQEAQVKLDHAGIEVLDLFTEELFYRTAFGFSPRYRYVSRNSPGLRTVFLASSSNVPATRGSSNAAQWRRVTCRSRWTTWTPSLRASLPSIFR